MAKIIILIAFVATVFVGLSEATCGQNEILDDCSNAGCEKRDCFEVGQSFVCRDVAAGGCIPGCVCVKDYLRAANGTCVPVDECPANEICKSKQNQYLEKCPNSSEERKCDNGNQSDPRLTQPKEGSSDCGLPMCRCKEGFYENAYRDCVTLEQCSINCDRPNELYSNCVNGGCGRYTCAELAFPQVCRDLAEGSCVPGCICAKDYLRDENGTCVPISQCPESKPSPPQYPCDDTEI